MPLPNPERQKAAREKLGQVFAHRETVYAIHYACQSFYSGRQLASTRVGCIAVRQLASGQVTTFSIGKTAELYRMAANDIARNWDALERTMLGEFYEFVRTNKSARFVHWNMRDDTYGFAALEHRFQVLGGRPEPIAEHNRLDLARLLLELFGDRIVREKNKLIGLSKLNGFSMADVLAGAEEAQALQEGQYRRVQMSTQTKVKLIADLATAANDRTLRTEAGFVANQLGPLRLMLQKAIDNPGYTLASGLAGGFFVMLKAYDWLFGG
jgi:hypothetical protein